MVIVHVDQCNRRFTASLDGDELTFRYPDAGRKVAVSGVAMVRVALKRDPAAWLWIKPYEYTNALYSGLMGIELYSDNDRSWLYSTISIPKEILPWVKDRIIEDRLQHLMLNDQARRDEEAYRRRQDEQG